jgi:D-inositol-3-phosphate glycosyltransferase
LLIAATPAERIQLMWLYGANMRKIQVVPPGVNIHHFRPMPRHAARRILGMADGEQMLLFVGRIEPLKGVETLLRSLAILKQEIPDCAGKLRLSIIGGTLEDAGEEGTELSRLMALADELELSKCISFLGAKCQALLPTYYAAAEMVMMPSHYESFGMVALEAMACGTPVVASEVGGLAYLVQDGVTGFHVPASSPEELAGKIRLLLENPTLRQEMSIAAVEYAQHYDWELIAERVEQLYQKVLDSYSPTVEPQPTE